MPKDHALQASVSGNQNQTGAEVRTVVLAGAWIQQMHPSQIAFAAPDGIESRGRADRQEFRAESRLLQPTQQMIQPDAMAADHDQIGQRQVAAQQLDLNDRRLLDDLLMPADGHEPVGMAKGGDRTGALAHRVRGQRDAVIGFFAALNKADQQILGAADLRVDFNRQPGRHDRRRFDSAASQPAEDGCHELVKREDRRRGEPGQDHHRLARGGGQTDRFARFERDAVGDDAGVGQFADGAVREIALALACPARQQDRIALGQRFRDPPAQQR